MKHSTAVLAAAGLAACAATNEAPEESAEAAAEPVAPAASEDRIFDLPYTMRELDNGLRVIVVPTDFPDIVTIQIPVQTGSRNEVEPGKSGFAHFFEHMMFRGTERYPVEAYGAILQNAGADQNAYTTDDYTNYHITFTRADLEKVIELEADRFRNLSYSEEDFRTEALAVKGEYLKNYSNPIQKVVERIRDLGFDEHTYQHTTMGFFEDIEAMPEQKTYADTFFDRWYRPEKTAVILVGDLDPAETMAMVERYWGGWERGDYAVEVPVEPPLDGPRYEHIEWEAPTQPWLMLAFRGPAFVPGGRDMPAMDLVSAIYFSESSALYQELVIEKQLVDELFTWFPDRRDPYLLHIAARLTDPAHAPAVSEAIAATLARARTEPATGEKVEATESRLRYDFAAGMDNSEDIGAILAAYVQHERTPETINEAYRAYAALTPEDVRRLADEYFRDSRMAVVTLSNAPSLPGFEEGLGEAHSVDARAAALRARAPADIALLAQRSETTPLVDVVFLFETGAADDPPGKKGLAALTAAMIAEGGSAARTIQEIDEAMYPMAATFEAQVDKEMTRFAGTVHRDNLDAWYELASAQLLEPGWRESDFERLKTQTVNAIRTNLVANNDEELAKEVLYTTIYGADHPYGTLNLGAVSDLEALTLDDVRGFYREHYTIGRLTLGLAGGYPDGFEERVTADAQQLPRGERVGGGAVQGSETRDAGISAAEPAGSMPVPEPREGRRAVIVEKETPAVAVSFGYPIELRRGDPDWVALWLMRSWLGEHRSSNAHLYQRIREARGMNYGDYAYIEYFPRGMFQFQPDPNLARERQIFQVWLRPLRDNDDALFATRTALYEMDRLIEEGMSEADFEATRNFLTKYAALLSKTQARRLGYALDSEYYGIGPFVDYVREGLAALTVEDVNRVIRRHLQTDDLDLVFVAKDARGLAAALAADRPSPIEYNTDKPAELLAEDERIEALPLGLDRSDVTVIPASELFR